MLKNTSKFWVIIGCLSLLCMRLIYFSTAFFQHHFVAPTPTEYCMIEYSMNLPVMLEFINIFIIHEFLLRVYLTMSQQVDKYKKTLMVYTATIVIIYTIVTITVS